MMPTMSRMPEDARKQKTGRTENRMAEEGGSKGRGRRPERPAKAWTADDAG
jgi:hypothetical protein